METERETDHDGGTTHPGAKRVRRLGKLLDEAVRVPGTDFRIGLDPILGINTHDRVGEYEEKLIGSA